MRVNICCKNEVSKIQYLKHTLILNIRHRSFIRESCVHDVTNINFDSQPEYLRYQTSVEKKRHETSCDSLTASHLVYYGNKNSRLTYT